MGIKKIMKNIKNKLIFSFRSDSNTYIKYLKNKGMSIGKNTYFISAKDTWVDDQKPWMISIGENCVITAGVTILSHDYSWIVLKNAFGDIIGNIKKTVIGNNCFIGMNSIILCGTHIGDNVIIGANSTVSGVIPDNSVIAGSPAKVICSLDEFRNKRKEMFCEETINMGIEYYKRYHKDIPKEQLKEHFFAFNNNIENLEDVFVEELDTEKIVRGYKSNIPCSFFKDYDEFIIYCREKATIGHENLVKR